MTFQRGPGNLAPFTVVYIYVDIYCREKAVAFLSRPGGATSSKVRSRR